MKYLVIALALLLSTHAEARHRHHRHAHTVKVMPSSEVDFFTAWESPLQAVTQPMGKKLRRMVTYLPHPRGCPRTLFCGCGASAKVFGHPVRSLWLVSNWRKFPRAHASHGMAALSRRRGGGHVVILDKHVRGSIWMVYDYNSGRHLSRYHARSIAGYTIVNPRASHIVSSSLGIQ